MKPVGPIYLFNNGLVPLSMFEPSLRPEKIDQVGYDVQFIAVGSAFSAAKPRHGVYQRSEVNAMIYRATRKQLVF
jgi:hypothetical protein